jgi:hypothetical protein
VRAYNPPPNWPQPPSGWVPNPGWYPDPGWPPPPDGWDVWLPDPVGSEPSPPAADGEPHSGEPIGREGLGQFVGGRRSRSDIFNPPPNWPQPPPGWRPHRGWVPDPAWPPPPDRWPVWLSVPPNRGKRIAVGLLAIGVLIAMPIVISVSTSGGSSDSNVSAHDQCVATLSQDFLNGYTPPGIINSMGYYAPDYVPGSGAPSGSDQSTAETLASTECASVGDILP